MTTTNTRPDPGRCDLATYCGRIEGGRVVCWVYIIAPVQEPT